LGATKNVGLKKESVINISQVITLDKSYLIEKTGKLSTSQRQELNEGLKLVLDI
jgi:mRNA interferase MazF